MYVKAKDFARVFLRFFFFAKRMMDMFFKRPISFTKKKKLIRKKLYYRLVFRKILKKNLNTREIEYKNPFQNNILSTIFSYQTRKANRKHFPRYCVSDSCTNLEILCVVASIYQSIIIKNKNNAPFL